MPRTIATVTLLIVLSQLVLAPVTNGAEVTRAQYVEQGEPICKANTIANRHTLEGTQQDVREGRLRHAGGKFDRAARALHRTIKRLEPIPRPSADKRLLARWFTHQNDEVRLLERVASQLLKDSRKGLGRYVLELRHNANVTNNVVLTFGFEFCLIQTARYI